MADPIAENHPPPDPNTWVELHGDFLFRYAYARLGDRTVCEDVVQDTFLAALRDWPKFAGRSAERSWLVGILKHKIVDHLRREGRRVAETSVSAWSPEELFDAAGRWRCRPARWSTNPQDVLTNKEFWETFWHCLQTLPQRVRTAFCLREMHELTRDDICAALQITPTNLGVMLYRARMGLRRCLEVNWFEA